MAEVWKPVVGFEGIYEVSSHGRVKNTRTNTMKAQIYNKTTDRYKVSLWKDGKERQSDVAVIVAEAFIGPRPEGLVVNHKDLDYWNNKVENLEYVTQTQNLKHSVKIRGPWGSCDRLKAFTAQQVEEIREKCKTRTQTSVAKEYGVARVSIYRVLHGRDGQPYKPYELVQ